MGIHGEILNIGGDWCSHVHREWLSAALLDALVERGPAPSERAPLELPWGTRCVLGPGPVVRSGELASRYEEGKSLSICETLCWTCHHFQRGGQCKSDLTILQMGSTSPVSWKQQSFDWSNPFPGVTSHVVLRYRSDLQAAVAFYTSGEFAEPGPQCDFRGRCRKDGHTRARQPIALGLPAPSSRC